MTSLPQDSSPDQVYLAKLERAIEQIWEIAQAYGPGPLPVHFELVPATIMYEFGAYGLPGRFRHWTHGKAYYRMKTKYDYGLSKIYELVINTNPSYAFLMEQNDLLQNQVVVAHVLGHTDFFKNNVYFRSTPPKMIDKVSVNADRIRQYEFDHGIERSSASSTPCWPSKSTLTRTPTCASASSERRDDEAANGEDGARKRSSVYDDLWALDISAEQANDAAEAEQRAETRRHRFPAEPEKDILKFLAEHAPNLEPWQRDMLLIVREEMLYFVPQMRTKIMNEGWASLLARAHHARAGPRRQRVHAVRAHARRGAGALAQRINPYYVGYICSKTSSGAGITPRRRSCGRGGRRAGPRQDLRGARDGERRLVPAQLPDQGAGGAARPVPLQERGRRVGHRGEGLGEGA